MDNNSMSFDERYIMSIFSSLMRRTKNNNLFVFGKNNDNGYSIFKKDNRWILSKEENGVVIVYNQYTNLYNLCMDCIKKLDNEQSLFCSGFFLANIKIPKDTEVLIFNRAKDCKFDETNFIKGKIIGRREMDELYYVAGEDNRYYTGRYGNAEEGYFFKTMEDYITHLINVVEINYKKINDLKNENDKYRELLGEIVIANDTELFPKKK